MKTGVAPCLFQQGLPVKRLPAESVVELDAVAVAVARSSRTPDGRTAAVEEADIAQPILREEGRIKRDRPPHPGRRCGKPRKKPADGGRTPPLAYALCYAGHVDPLRL